MLRMLGRLFQFALCIAAVALGVWVGELFNPTPLPAPKAAPSASSVPMPGASRAASPLPGSR